MAHDLLEQNGLYANFTSVPRGTCGALAGVYRRSADVVPSRLFADTTTRAVTVCTPSCYVDLRISRDRAAVPSRAALAALSLEALGELVCATHCFGGVATSTRGRSAARATSGSTGSRRRGFAQMNFASTGAGQRVAG